MLAHRDVISASKPSPGLGLLPGRGATSVEALPRWSGALLSAVTHEIRTPLTVIRAYSSVVLSQKSKLSASEMADLMRHIDSSARLVEVIVSDLETLAKQESVRMRLVAVDLAKFLRDVVTDLQALAPGRRLQVVLQRDALRLRADPLRLRQVLHNLVENAHKYSNPAGRISIMAARIDGQVVLSVEDEGPGVPPEEIERIFEPFYRSFQAEQEKGSGLGLAICKGLVESQGGVLQAAQTPWGSFQLTLTLPASGS
jgi:two-component system sensor histidine kinase KdpD